MALPGDDPIPSNTPQYIPVFPFYEAEPTWFYKGYSTSSGNGDSGGDDDLVLLFSETVTTVDHEGIYASNTLAYNNVINSDVIIVTFDGMEYTCSRIDDGAYFYGGYDGSEHPIFTEYPFCLVFTSSSYGNTILTQTASTHTISVKVHQDDVPDLDPDPK